MHRERKLAKEFSDSLISPLYEHEVDRLENLLKSVKRKALQKVLGDLDFSQYDHPTARAADPISSHSGVDREATTRQREAVLREVQSHPGRTARELASEAGLDYEMVHKRLPELRTEGKLTNSRGGTWRNIRRCSITGRKAMEWWPTKGQA